MQTFSTLVKLESIYKINTEKLQEIKKIVETHCVDVNITFVKGLHEKRQYMDHMDHEMIATPSNFSFDRAILDDPLEIKVACVTGNLIYKITTLSQCNAMNGNLWTRVEFTKKYIAEEHKEDMYEKLLGNLTCVNIGIERAYEKINETIERKKERAEKLLESIRSKLKKLAELGRVTIQVKNNEAEGRFPIPYTFPSGLGSIPQKITTTITK